jgi:hypothetical protein
VRVLSRLFRRLFLELLQQAFDDGQLHFFTALQQLQVPSAFAAYLAPLRQAEWVVYAKAPFAGPQQVLDYVGRYTHRVAISNHRLLDIENGQVQFRYKDYRQDGQQKTMPLSADEFIRRFLLHVLPDGFHRIRYYGFLGNRYRQEKLERCRQLLGMAVPATEPPKDYRDQYEELTGISLGLCPVCRHGQTIRIGGPLPRPAHPQRYGTLHENARLSTSSSTDLPKTSPRIRVFTHSSRPLSLLSFSLCTPQIFSLRAPDALAEFLFGTTPPDFRKPSSDSMTIAPAPSRRFSPIHF